MRNAGSAMTSVVPVVRFIQSANHLHSEQMALTCLDYLATHNGISLSLNTVSGANIAAILCPDPLDGGTGQDVAFTLGDRLGAAINLNCMVEASVRADGMVPESSIGLNLKRVNYNSDMFSDHRVVYTLSRLLQDILRFEDANSCLPRPQDRVDPPEESKGTSSKA